MAQSTPIVREFSGSDKYSSDFKLRAVSFDDGSTWQHTNVLSGTLEPVNIDLCREFEIPCNETLQLASSAAYRRSICPRCAQGA